LTSIESIPTNAREITGFLLETPENTRPFLLQRIGHCRRNAGISAAAVYGDALACDALAPLHQGMIDAIVEEGGADAIDLLQKLRDGSANAKSRTALQAALLRLGTRAIDPKKPAPAAAAGTAYVGSCDGQGAFVVISAFKKPNGTMTLADLCIRVAADVRDGFVLTRQTSKDVKNLLNHMKQSSNIDFAAVPLEQAAWLVSEALERTSALKLEIPVEATPAVNLLRPLFERGLREKSVVEPAKEVTLAQVRRLLSRPVYYYWFFEIPALLSANVNPPPSDKEPPNRWFESAARKLDKPALRERVVAMARYMAYWHAWRGEEALAAQCQAMALTTERDFAKSPLVRVMLERSLTVEPEEETLEAEAIGTPEIRQYLKSIFFDKLNAPTGKDLAILDLTEVAMSSLEHALSVLPGERRPREDRRSEIAYTVANECFALFSNRNRADIEKHMDAIVKEFIKKFAFKKREALDLVAILVYALTQFVENICSECALDCFSHPTSDMSADFFSPHHPMATFLGEDDDNEQLELDDLWSR
jgi:hypothetical protein